MSDIEYLRYCVVRLSKELEYEMSYATKTMISNSIDEIEKEIKELENSY